MARVSLPMSVYKPLYNNRLPLCVAFDADSGGDIKGISALVLILPLKGVSMHIIEDRAVSESGKNVYSFLIMSDK